MTRMFSSNDAGWRKLQDLPNRAFVCGYCNTTVSTVKGYGIGALEDGSGRILGGTYICPNCLGPNLFTPNEERYPSPVLGNSVQHVPTDLYALYGEARRCAGQSCFTGAVLLCRKLLMNIAVAQGATPGLKFIEYVSYLADAGYVPPHGKHWVDHIRKKGNEATHEIALMSESDARDLLQFMEMLLRFIFEFPSMIPTPV